ncbi:MAG: HPr family phosphocarrier protein [Gammaproteobacteria bacterium]|nr:MAG: HPr family phosphocarrier protein [Gammaproteobacteria bacterium]
MQEREIEIVNKLGLHARAAARLVNLTSRFESRIEMGRNGQMVNAKSIMGVMMLAASRGTRLKVIAEGPDEREAIEAIVELVGNRFDEEE